MPMEFVTFEDAAVDAERWIIEMMAELHTADRSKAVACLRAGLQAVRESVSAEEAAEIAQRLPLIVRGLFFEGWSPAERNPLAFPDLVRLIHRRHATCEARVVARAIVCVLQRCLPDIYIDIGDDCDDPQLDSVLAQMAA
jgi:uncharacterized protein (DUF2267 family)